MQELKFASYSIVCEELPDEVSLAINISGCPRRCEGCHSKYLWKYRGRLLSQYIDELLDEYEGLITCVVFMGGDQNIDELKEHCANVRRRGLKVCIYSGGDTIYPLWSFIAGRSVDYIKIGRYIEELGGLNSAKTNQRMYKIHGNGYLESITKKFQKRDISV